MADEEADGGYRWETGYEKTWEAIKEDDDGLVEGSIADIIQKAKRKRQALKKSRNRLGMMRHVYVIVDCTSSMSVQDLKPTRMICTVKLLEMFLEEFFDQNPISQLGMIVMKNKRAEKLSELAGSARKHIKAAQSLLKLNLSGEPSVQNGLELAIKSLKLVPSHASREIVLLMGSLTTCDPTDIHETIETLKTENIRCSVISLSASMRICQFMTQETNGVYSAVLDDAHFKDQLLQHVEPCPSTTNQEHSLIKMGFPHGRSEEQPILTMCMCHIDSTEDPSKLTSSGYQCPQCQSKYCELPVECVCCGLTLALAHDLARSYHHLFPVASFTELAYELQAGACYACQKSFSDSDKHIYKCEICQNFFCVDCDQYIHEILHCCVGCNTKAGYR